MQHKYLELIWLRGASDLKVDKRNSHLGMIWWVLEPLLLTGLFFLAFATGLRGAGNEGFLVLLLSGMLPFKWTSACIAGSANSVITNNGLIGQVYLPKWIFPSSVNLAMVFRYAFVLPVLLTFIVFYSGNAPTLSWTTLGYVVLCQLVFNIGLSYLIASWVPLIPDLAYIVPLLIMGLMFTSGIFFDINDRPEEIQAILRLNPFVEIVDAYRAVLLRGESITPLTTLYAWLSGFAYALVGLATFKVFDRYYPRALP